ncbi:MAG: hypothetical protein HYR97_00945 [Candidatus Melainabacteria bacterium]|nr:hypothetical protein [Candidatus Melainabacteria bacterium]MBI3309650.1 hypothetical protein [Candidatus Melainabacteria bacterium]
MIYNPIFEEETEKKSRISELKQLKKAIVKRTHKRTIKQTLDRVYNLLKKSPISNWLNSNKDLVETTK